MSQQRLASSAGIALRTLVRIEQGEDTRLSTLEAIAGELGIAVADLVAGSAA